MIVWPESAVWWQVYPLGFTGAPASASPGEPVAHRLRGLEPWLDYLAGLGCTGLALGPVFASETHGYDTVDHFRIDPRLGDEGDFDRLVAALRERGLRLLLDGVFNHVGRGFPVFRRALEGDPEAARWFRRTGDDPAGGYATFEGHHALVALNHAEPAVAAHVEAVLSHWLDRGADGWRLDAAYAVPPGFWRRVLPPVRARHPGAWFAGEMIHGDYASYVAESGLDSVTQYELWKAIWSSLNDRNLFELAWALDRHDAFAEKFLPLTFVGNHDVTRIATRLDDPRHLGHALAILFTVAGTPAVYYGDERAMEGVKEDRPGGDDAIRPPFPAVPFAGSPPEAHTLHRELIALRRANPWLARARTEVLHLTNEAMAYASAAGDRRLTVLLNTADTPYAFPGGLGTVAAHSWSVVPG
ncbi:alpha-amylase family glycosyl hydrolase [Bailinhaonella thermotolerans]|uniref:DUF3459 domain-containing protein n=1 Tax=Bailinhaonella thermotolerans TaxID=1070861 RepID=A0A3A4A9V5_9ACTN|nr:alpha-amylase family glycosyl hydrolase [Bailinhaonella thermotolerans]RJL22830.1 DUF3459 domain-containing protein [Bailinhaonella thermotolerans]